MSSATDLERFAVDDDDLLTPRNSAIVFIDWQPQMLRGVANVDHAELRGNASHLAAFAKRHGVPTVLTSLVHDDEGGRVAPSLLEVLLGEPVVLRRSMNAWDDTGFRKAIESTGRRRIVLAGLSTEVCVTWSALDLLEEGYDVFVVDDCCGAASAAAHRAAVRGMVQAGAMRITSADVARHWRDSENHGRRTGAAVSSYVAV